MAPGGTIANVGVHGAKVDLHLERLWSQNITITTRLVDTVTTPVLLKPCIPKDRSKAVDHTSVQTRSDNSRRTNTFGRAAGYPCSQGHHRGLIMNSVSNWRIPRFCRPRAKVN